MNKNVPVSLLVGKCATRTGPLMSDNSYTDSSVWIQSVSPHGHIMYKVNSTYDGIMGPKWNDDKWKRASDETCANIRGFTEASARSGPSNIGEWQSVPVSYLTNKCAIRTARPTGGYIEGIEAFYITEPAWIKEVLPHGLVVQTSSISSRTVVLSQKWNDTNWVKAPDSMCNNIFGFQQAMSRQQTGN